MGAVPKAWTCTLGNLYTCTRAPNHEVGSKWKEEEGCGTGEQEIGSRCSSAGRLDDPFWPP